MPRLMRMAQNEVDLSTGRRGQESPSARSSREASRAPLASDDCQDLLSEPQFQRYLCQRHGKPSSEVSTLAAANAAYDYTLALLFVNREIGHFRNLDDEEAQKDFERRLNEFVLAADAAQSKAPPPP